MISHFELTEENQEKDQLLKLSNFSAKKIGGTIIDNSFDETFIKPVHDMVLLNEHVDSVLFIRFEHLAGMHGDYIYHMRYEHSSEAEPGKEFIVYIDSKLTNEDTGERSTFHNFYGFDMKPFIEYYYGVYPEKESLEFEIRFLTGFDSNGEKMYEIYKHGYDQKSLLEWKPENTSAREFKFK